MREVSSCFSFDVFVDGCLGFFLCFVDWSFMV